MDERKVFAQPLEARVNRLVMTAKLHQEVIESLEKQVKMMTEQFAIIVQQVQKALAKGDE